KTHVDRDFPAIAPEDAIGAATAISQLVTVLPELASVSDVLQVALMALGINNTAEVLDKIQKESAGNGHNANARLIKALREYKTNLVEKNDLS
ncbi:MAG: hypothetical protein KKD77_21790, partial [Gammaproteobacteria bacterium]|nr:hypothetical protein [Gammaproteobacteria bacterium]